MRRVDGGAGRFIVTGIPGTELDEGTERVLSRVRPSGVILFARNIESPRQLRSLTDAIRELLGEEALIFIDQEGGRVDRLASLLGKSPSARDIARLGDPLVARKFYRATGKALTLLGVDVDLAPVLDLDLGNEDNGIGDRSFGREPELVRLFAEEALIGLEDAGIAGCLKHFPGLGRTEIDTHEDLPRVRVDREELFAEDIKVFSDLLDEAEFVMVSHAHYPSLDEGPGVPASLSAKIMRKLLRDQLGFEGILLSDDLEMGALSKKCSIPEAAESSLSNGCDIILICQSPERVMEVHDSLYPLLESKPSLRNRLEEVRARVERFLLKRVERSRRVEFDDSLFERVRSQYGNVVDEVEDRIGHGERDE